MIWLIITLPNQITIPTVIIMENYIIGTKLETKLNQEFVYVEDYTTIKQCDNLICSFSTIDEGIKIFEHLNKIQIKKLYLNFLYDKKTYFDKNHENVIFEEFKKHVRYDFYNNLYMTKAPIEPATIVDSWYYTNAKPKTNDLKNAKIGETLHCNYYKLSRKYYNDDVKPKLTKHNIFFSVLTLLVITSLLGTTYAIIQNQRLNYTYKKAFKELANFEDSIENLSSYIENLESIVDKTNQRMELDFNNVDDKINNLNLNIMRDLDKVVTLVINEVASLKTDLIKVDDKVTNNLGIAIDSLRTDLDNLFEVKANNIDLNIKFDNFENKMSGIFDTKFYSLQDKINNDYRNMEDIINTLKASYATLGNKIDINNIGLDNVNHNIENIMDDINSLRIDHYNLRHRVTGE